MTFWCNIMIIYGECPSYFVGIFNLFNPEPIFAESPTHPEPDPFPATLAPIQPCEPTRIGGVLAYLNDE